MANQPSPASSQPPPDLPFMSDVSPALSSYLRRFGLWVRQTLDGKLSAREAVPGVLVMAYDATAGTTPKVYLIRVNSAGVISTVAMPLGSGLP